jgi:hypothetical protein
MGLRRCCGSLKSFAAILDEFQSKCAFGGNLRFQNIGIFQQNSLKPDFCCIAVLNEPLNGYPAGRLRNSLKATMDFEYLLSCR